MPLLLLRNLLANPDGNFKLCVVRQSVNSILIGLSIQDIESLDEDTKMTGPLVAVLIQAIEVPNKYSCWAPYGTRYLPILR